MKLNNVVEKRRQLSAQSQTGTPTDHSELCTLMPAAPELCKSFSFQDHTILAVSLLVFASENSESTRNGISAYPRRDVKQHIALHGAENMESSPRI